MQRDIPSCLRRLSVATKGTNERQLGENGKADGFLRCLVAINLDFAF